MHKTAQAIAKANRRQIENENQPEDDRIRARLKQKLVKCSE